jgi:hypothetical protein
VRPHSFVQRSIVLLSRPPRRHRRLNGHRSRILSRSVINRSCAANHLTPVRPHSFEQCSIIVLTRPPRRHRRLNGHHRIRI